MKTEMTSDDQPKVISSFTERSHIGRAMETAKQFIEATNWNLGEAINILLFLHGKNQPLSDSTRFSSSYRQPPNLVVEVSFKDVRSISSRENRWLLVNLQTKTHNLGVLWNDAVSQAIDSSFTVFQVYEGTSEGQQISTSYKIESAPPVVLLIDPITGHQMRSWSGEIEAQRFLEDLMKYVHFGPHEYVASLTSNKRIKTEKVCFESNQANEDADMSNFWDDDFLEASEGNFFIFPEKVEENCSSGNHVVAPSWGEEECKQVEEEGTSLGFPVSTEEPDGDCNRSVEAFKSVQPISGASKTFEF